MAIRRCCVIKASSSSHERDEARRAAAEAAAGFADVNHASGLRWAHATSMMAAALAVFGRDQMGPVAEPIPAPDNLENRHPGFDYEAKARKKWYEPSEDMPVSLALDTPYQITKAAEHNAA